MLALEQLYEREYDRWLSETIELLKNRQFDRVDYEHLIEELEALSKRDKNRVESFLRQIIIHLLLWQYWSKEFELNHRHWQGEIATFRVQLNGYLSTNLEKYLLDNQERIYQDAVFIVGQKTEISPHNFPLNCPYSLEQMLDRHWLPERN